MCTLECKEGGNEEKREEREWREGGMRVRGKTQESLHSSCDGGGRGRNGKPENGKDGKKKKRRWVEGKWESGGRESGGLGWMWKEG